MDVTVTYAGRDTAHRRVLAVTSGARGGTNLLYVVTMPRPFRGSALLIRDPAAGALSTRMWLYLPSLDAFREIETKSLSLLVPGTGITYEDSRGWIPSSRYRFRTIAATIDEVTIEAVPRTDSIATIVGAARVLIQADSSRSVVTGVAFYDRADQLVRRYDAKAFVQLS